MSLPRWARWIAGVGAALGTTGCADNPFIGVWEQTEPECAAPSGFTVEDDLSGVGTLYIDMGGCVTCGFTFDSEGDSNRVYTAQITFDDATCACTAAELQAAAECAMNANEDHVDCVLIVPPCSYTRSDGFRKISE